MIKAQAPPQRSRGGHRVDAMHVDAESGSDADDAGEAQGDLGADDTLFALHRAAGIPPSLKGELLCHNCLG